MRWIVHKFGGTSVANAARYQGVARILRQRHNAGSRVGVVVSAMSGVTDALIRIVEAAGRRDESYLENLSSLKERHLTELAGLELLPERAQSLCRTLDTDFRDLEEVLRGVYIA